MLTKVSITRLTCLLFFGVCILPPACLADPSDPSPAPKKVEVSTSAAVDDLPAAASKDGKSMVLPESAPAESRHSESINASRYVQIPVLYMTDRQMAHQVYGAFRMNEQGHVYRLPCGTLDYTLENDEHKNSQSESLGWKPGCKPGKLPFLIHPLKMDNEADVYDKFGEIVAAAATKSAHNEIFVYVHGYNNSFEAGAARAARLAYTVQCPVVLYSWPSTAKMLQYSVDAENNEWSQEHFNRLMEELMLVKEKTGVKVNLVAHSMGNRLAVRSAPITSGKHFFSQVFLVDPDFDAETFVHYALRYLHGGQSGKNSQLRILFSRKDRALPFAQLLFGGYTRLGQGADTFLESLLNPLALPKTLQDTASAIGKLNPLADDSPAPNEKEAKDRLYNRFEWIDFTLLDHGFMGHSVPYELIASLWSTGKPGPGLSLVDDEAGQVNRITRFIARSLKQKQRIGDWGKCQRVVFTKDLPPSTADAQK